MNGEESNEEYRELVEKELAQRERQLLAIDRKIDEIRFKLEGSMQTRNMRQGNAMKIASAESYRARLRKALERMEHERIAASAALKMAKERLALLEEDEN